MPPPVPVFPSGAPSQEVEAAPFPRVQWLWLINSLVRQGSSSAGRSEVSHVGIQMSQMNGRTRSGRQRSRGGFGHDARVRRRPHSDGRREAAAGSDPKQGREEGEADIMKLPVQQTEGSS